MINNILQAIKNSGGTPFFVGGCVRDQILGIKPKDFDIEVYGLTETKLTEVLSKFGKTNSVGSSFGVIKLNLSDGTDFDFSLPRKENKVGMGHKGFIVEFDSSITPFEAAQRRDFTFNALFQDPFTQEIKDFFGGQKDLRNKVLRHTSIAFSEDSLRVLRGMQFAGRFNLTPAKETIELCKILKSEFSTLAKERVWEEFWKWATKSVKPSAGLKFLKETEWVELFPEISNLINCPQDPDWHPEGDVFTHTCFTCDAAAEIATRENLLAIDKGILVLAALCHDMGKVETTIFEDGHWKSPAHDKVGSEVTFNFLTSLGAPNEIINQVTEMVREHMVHVHNTGEISKRVVRRFLSRLKNATVKQIMLVIEADHSGRPPLNGGLPETALKISQITSEMGDEIKPILLGRHLIEIGIQPGPEMGKLLKSAFEAQIEGEFSTIEEGIKWITK